MTVQNPAPGYPHIVPYLMIENGRGEEAVAFYTRHFKGRERMRLPMQDKDGNPRIGHSELQFGDSVLMLSDFCETGKIDYTSVNIMLNVDNIDAVFAAALAAGATEIMPLEDMFYGDRTAKLRCPFGHIWYLNQHIRDVSEAEMRAVMAKMGGG